MKTQEFVNFENFLPHASFGNIRTQVMDLINNPGEFLARNVTGYFTAGMTTQTVGYA